MEQGIDLLLQKEEKFQFIHKMYGRPPIVTRSVGFETLCLLILEQQVSIDSAKATFLKLKNSIPNFTPESVLEFSAEEFRACGVSRQKTVYLKALSHAIVEKHLDIESLAKKDAQTVREELIKIKGIGHWTIDVYLMFCLQSPDIIPLGDIAVVNTIKELFDIHDKEKMADYAEKWKPHRSVATFFLWHYYLQKRGRKNPY
ncbi:DNA-3-methyladenine glycosylase 2 family protein [Flavobacterium sp. SM15]|uniref:DNA-3-methyladenine glycosylase family protein n=1 Tax=Flavobacterium sp. SM15 TaxID=2908005 RepID=UPI001EDB865B|nr:DNA-3-methyladenine glycosylase 2 family protein [Flavobacterium sp. SM15]MCG2609940.1 DNA-3-methyladenine glycosylase 2 family protein [Flavobacterium sp. SM15]